MKNALNTPEWGGYVSARSYIVGYLLSLILTLAAFFIVEKNLIAGFALPATLLGLALVQAGVQLVYFFNLGKEPKPAWSLIAFIFMIALLLIIVIGSLLIMYSLDYRMMA